MKTFETAIRKIKHGMGFTSDSGTVKFLRPIYDLLLKIIYKGAGVERKIHGEQAIRLNPRYRSITENSEPTVFEYLKSHAQSGGIVLDIGANVGVFSLLMARWVGEAGQVYAFEPAPESLRALHNHVQLNQLSERIMVVGQAVSDMVGEATFYAHSYNGENSLNSGHRQRVPTARAVRVPVTTVDAFCAAECVAPTLLKIDIEGFEWHALRGAKETLARYRPNVLVEVHPMNWAEIGESPETAAETLQWLGYRAVPLEGQANPLTEFGHVVLEPIS